MLVFEQQENVGRMKFGYLTQLLFLWLCIGKYGHIGILYTGGSIYPEQYLVAIPGVCFTIVGIT